MNENELKAFLDLAAPMLKELPKDEIIKQLNRIDMTEDERAEFLKVIFALKDEENN